MTLIMKVPLTGTLLTEGPFPSGDDKDPVRPINILASFDVSWRMIELDLENEEMEIEIKCLRHVGMVDPDTENLIPDETESAWEARKTEAFARIQDVLLNRTKEELYAVTGERRLKRPFKGGKI